MYRRQSSLAAAALIAIAAAVTTGCGTDNAAGDGAKGASGATIAFVQGFTTDEYYVTEKCGFEAEARKRGMKPIVDGPANFDPTEQTPVLQAVLRRQPKAVLLDPTDAKAMVAPIQEAKNKQIPLMTSGNSVDSSVPFTFISANQTEGGKLAAEKLIDLLPEGGKVVVIGAKPGATATDQRQKGFEDAIKAAGNFELLPTQIDASNDPTQASSLLAASLRAHPDLAGVFAVNVNTAKGVINQLRLANKGGKVKAVAFDAAPAEVQAIKDGLLQGAVSQNPRKIGELSVQSIQRQLKGETNIPKEQPQTPFVIDEQNVDSAEGKAAAYVGSC
jgi:ribose transport system substrate-binding protein